MRTVTIATKAICRIILAILAGSLFFPSPGFGRAGPTPQPASTKFECILPYVSGGGIVTLISTSAEDQVVEITAENAYRYNIVVQGHSTYSFQSAPYDLLMHPIIDAGPISFKSEQPIVAYTILKEDSVTIQCSDPDKNTKIFMGGENTGIALVNITTAPIDVLLFQDNMVAPILRISMGPGARMLRFVHELLPIPGNHDYTHNYMLVAASNGIGVSAVSYERKPATATPVAEHECTHALVLELFRSAAPSVQSK